MAGELAIIAEDRSIWEQLAHLTHADFPMRIYFLDKSPSMRFDDFTFSALGMAALNALSPKRGSSLTFMLSSPGETLVFFRRPTDPPLELRIDLGSSTWVNEPILQVLQAIAPKVEALRIDTWARTYGEPPLQVVCVTDGQDNRSPSDLQSLAGLVDAVKQIHGSHSGLQLFRPMADPLEKCSKADIVGNSSSQIPVWLVWVAMGSAGRHFLDGGVPKEIMMVNAVVNGMGSSSSGSRLGVGARVQVKRPSWDGYKVHPAVVVDVAEDESDLRTRYIILYDDDVEDTNVYEDRFVLDEEELVTNKMQDCVPAVRALCLLDMATTEPGLLISSAPGNFSESSLEALSKRVGLKPERYQSKVLETLAISGDRKSVV